MTADSVTISCPACPLCGQANARERRRIDCNAIRNVWKTQLDIDIARELGSVKELRECVCPHCGLGFFDPLLAGSGWLYEMLQQKVHGYYLPERWEYDVAIDSLDGAQSVLEVGCGVGDFLVRLQSRQMRLMGIELNQIAAKAAGKRGLEIRTELVEATAEKEAETFDVVCNFQVLEHVTAPASFVGACARLLRPGGRLIICVPDNDSFIQRDPLNLWNLPPHHVLLWNAKSLKHVANQFGLQVERIRLEPLAYYHEVWWRRLILEPQLDWLPTHFAKPILRVAAWALSKPLIRHRIRGERIFVQLRKPARS